MGSRRQLPRHSKFVGVLEYFDHYDYPLTREEQIFWWSPINAKVGNFESKSGFAFLPRREKLVTLRQEREEISQKKWQIAKEVGERLKKFSFIEAIFVTGSLSMNNATKDDDIDFMVVTKANTLWLTRFLVNTYLSPTRRYPNQKNVSDVICINLWLDENNLAIREQGLYMAHEILQAKVLWDRNNIQQKFLATNAWVSDYLPNAYPKLQNAKYPLKFGANIVWGVVNCFFFVLQYVYMLPKMTTEKVNLGSAFFHPKKVLTKKS